jgi:hypothetical protein
LREIAIGLILVCMETNTNTEPTTDETDTTPAEVETEMTDDSDSYSETVFDAADDYDSDPDA